MVSSILDLTDRSKLITLQNGGESDVWNEIWNVFDFVALLYPMRSSGSVYTTGLSGFVYPTGLLVRQCSVSDSMPY